MKGEVITHRAKVIHVADNYVDVVVLSESACASCHAKGYCGAAESREKRMVIETPLASYFSEGEEVEVYTETVMGIKAVWIAYILPFLLVLYSSLFIGAISFACIVASRVWRVDFRSERPVCTGGVLCHLVRGS